MPRAWWILAVIAAVALRAGAPAAAADGAASPGSAQCGERTLAACTRERVEALRRLSGTLKRAAEQKPPVPPAAAKDREALARYDGWLAEQGEKAARLAAVGQQALLGPGAKNTAETQMSFNLQYLQLQSAMQNENRQFTAVSNIMKTKHDTVKNSISNIR